jgi:hypothetical protein
MAMRFSDTAPMMLRGTGFHRHDATRLIRRELIQTWSRHRSVENNGAVCRNAANLKTALDKINLRTGYGTLDAVGRGHPPHQFTRVSGVVLSCQEIRKRS